MKSTVEYSIGSYQIRINIWLLIVFLIMQTILNELGFWQLNRAKEKQLRLYQIEQGEKQTISSLSKLKPENLEQFQRVELGLQLESRRSIYIDSKTHNKAPGYHVLNLFRDNESGKFILVNRGWIFGGKDRNTLPPVTAPQLDNQVTGRLYPITDAPVTAIKGELENMSGGIRVPFISTDVLTELQENFGVTIESYLVRLDKENNLALEVDWQWTNMPVEKHLAYAVQWFGLALALLIISLIVAIKKRR